MCGGTNCRSRCRSAQGIGAAQTSAENGCKDLLTIGNDGIVFQFMRYFLARFACRGTCHVDEAAAAFEKSLAALPLTVYRAGETILAEGSRTDQLLILRTGNVAVIKADIKMAGVSEPGGECFGEISALLQVASTQQRCARWQAASSTSCVAQPRYQTLPRSSTSRRSWRGVLTAPISALVGAHE